MLPTNVAAPSWTPCSAHGRLGGVLDRVGLAARGGLRRPSSRRRGSCCSARRYVILALMMEAHPPGRRRRPTDMSSTCRRTRGRARLLLVLHGGSSRGDGSHPRSIIHRLPPLRYVARARLLGSSSPLVDAGVLIAAPQSPGEWDAAKIDAFLDYLLATHDIDRDRVYLTGPSMGGCGTWLRRRPSRAVGGGA